MITRHPTTKAVITTLTVLTVKAWGLLTMKRATAPEVAFWRVALLTVKRNARSDQRRDRHAISDLIKKGWRKTHYDCHFRVR